MTEPTRGMKRPTPRIPSARTSSSAPRPRGSRSLAQTRTSPISSIGALAVVAVVLLAGLGYGYATRKQTKTVASSTAVAQLPLANASAVCLAMSGTGTDSYSTATVFTPGAATPGKGDTATVGYLPKLDNTPLKFGAPGTRAESQQLFNVPKINDPQGILQASEAPLVANVTGAYAPGFTMGEVVRTDTGPRRGLAATQCTSPGTDFWFAGVGYGTDRESRLYLSNSDPVPATVVLTTAGLEGSGNASTTTSYQLPANTGRYILLSTLMLPEAKTLTGSVHVTAMAGRVSAVLLDSDKDPKGGTAGGGMDFIPAQHPDLTADDQVQIIPGVPGAQSALDAMATTSPGAAGVAGSKTGKLPKIELTLSAIGDQKNVEVSDIKWITGGQITPSTVTFPLPIGAGKTVTVDLTGVPSGGEPGSLQITSNGGPLLTGVHIVDQSAPGVLSDSAYLAPAQALSGQAIVVDNKSGGKAHSYLYLTAPNKDGKGATVKVTRIGNTGAPAVDTIQVPAGQTYTQQLLPPSAGQGEFTTVVEVQPGSDPVYATRQIRDQPAGGVETTLQTLYPARLTAAVPAVESDLSGSVNR